MPWKRRLYCCPTCKRSRFFMLWQRISELIKEHQNFSPLLFFPFGLFGLKVRNPQNILWSMSWQLKPVQTALKCRLGLPCKASTADVTRATSWKPAATAATGESEEDTNDLFMKDILWVGVLRVAPFQAQTITARWSVRTVLLNTSQSSCRNKASFWKSAQRSVLVMENIL